jgi:basic membrane protein A
MLNNKKAIFYGSIILVGALLLSACGGGVAATQAATEAPAAETFKVAMVLPGPINDNDWNSVGFNGLKTASESMNLEYAYSENVSDADAERVLRDYATRGYKLIFAHSFSYGDAALKVAADFPDTYFMAGTAQKLAPNLGTYSNPDYQGAYLAGMLAASISKTGIIGWVSAFPIPNLLANLHSYEAGAMEVNPEIKVLHTFIGSFYDPPKAKEAALAQVEQGADVLSAQGVGVIDAAAEANVYALGAMTDQNFLGPQTVVTSVTWDLAPLVQGVVEAIMGGKWESKNWSYGIPEGSIKLAPYHDLEGEIPQEVKDRIQAKFEDIRSGKFVVKEDTTPVE